MVLNKLRQALYIKREIKIPVIGLLDELDNFRNADVIAICPKPTGNNWQGVLSATEGLFGKFVLKIPQYYSNPIYNNKELILIADSIKENNIRQVVFSGYLPYFDSLINQLNRLKVDVKVIYHGSHSTVLEDKNAANHFSHFVDLAKERKITKVGFVKKNLDKSFAKLTGLKCSQILLKTDSELIGKTYSKLNGTNVGVLSHDLYRKNLYNQVSAALLVDNSIVHMKQPYMSQYLGNGNRTIYHGYFADRDSFLNLLGSMQINLYVTYSECWGQFVNESLALGVPCLTSDVSAVLDFDAELKQKLVVREFDNDYAIYEKIVEVLSDLDWYKVRGPEYVEKVNAIAADNFQSFVFD